jgi:hypothetical protein
MNALTTALAAGLGETKKQQDQHNARLAMLERAVLGHGQ